MTDRLSLEQLVHLSLGDPEVGAVNFNVLKTLLLQMLRAMNLYNFKPTMSDDDQRTLQEALSTSSTKHDELSIGTNDDDDEIKRKFQLKRRDRSSDRLNTLEEKVFRFESQFNALDQIPSNSKLIDRSKQIPKKTFDQTDSTTDRQGPILEVWQYTQMEKRIESAENGITRLSSLLQDLLSDMNDLKESHETLQRATNELKDTVDTLNKEKHEWATKSDIANLDEKIRNLENLLSSLRDRFDSVPKETTIVDSPTTSDSSGFVTWDRFEDVLNDIRQSIEKLSNKADHTIRDTPSSPIKNQTTIQYEKNLSTDGTADISTQLQTLNDRYEQLKALVDALEKKKLNREEFDAYKNQYNDFFDRLTTLEKDFDGIQTYKMTSSCWLTEQLMSNINIVQKKCLFLPSYCAQNQTNTTNWKRLGVHLRYIFFQIRTFNNSNIRALLLKKFQSIKELFELIIEILFTTNWIDNNHNHISDVSGSEVKNGSPVKSRTDSSDDLSDFRTALKRLREDLDRLKQQIQDLITKGHLSADDLDTLKKLVQQLDQTKADKININNELDKKVDRKDLDNRVLKKDFNAACNDLSQNINDCLQKFHVHDDIQKKDSQKINHDLNEKLDRTELDALRDYMDKQMKKLKKLAKEQQQQTQQQHVHVMSEDEAAGLRKQLIRFHCISCDRPIDVQPHPQQPSLPVNQGMRPIQSPRPYTTYELDQIRQFQKSQQFSNDISSGAADVYATMRQCGGSHTTTLPFKRQIRTQPSVPEETLLARNEVDIKGHDGVIYKGRITVDKLPSVDLHKKNSIILLAPPPPLLRTRSDSHPLLSPHHHQQQQQHREYSGNDQDRNILSPIIPNLEPIIPREESFT
ncbi:hypothetical protein I4U23_024412 [Adineta vaga]|nr:hypothetical protein I4U23_024412 [Adineta vaga]